MAESKVKTLGISLAGRFASTGRKYAFLGRGERADKFGNRLSNSVLQPLGERAYTKTVAGACDLIHHVAFL